MYNDETAAKIANYLLEIEAVKLSPDKPFLWTSGLYSPIYCDNRVSLSYPDIRTFIKYSFAALIKSEFPQTEYIAGVATAGVAQGALVADALGLPYVYIRPEPKKHGMKNAVEGFLKEGAKVVLIEDLVSTGKSSLAAIKNLKDGGGRPIGLLSIFTYMFEEAFKGFEEAGCPYFSLSNFNVLLEEALRIGYITPPQKSTLEDWYRNPTLWSWNVK
jgi:orotate phosphoribosyltransferase